jgi:hypothetical protein
MLTRKQFIEWIALVQIEGPIGGGRDDMYAILQASGKPAPDVLWWLKEHVDEDEKPAEMYIPTAEERAWMASLPPRDDAMMM